MAGVVEIGRVKGRLRYVGEFDGIGVVVEGVVMLRASFGRDGARRVGRVQALGSHWGGSGGSVLVLRSHVVADALQ
jgi:hypothetical protein